MSVFIYRQVFSFLGRTMSQYVSFRAKFKYITNYTVFWGVKIIKHAQIYIQEMRSTTYIKSCYIIPV